MTTDALFDLAEFEETRVQWTPLYKPFGVTLLSLIVPRRCRDCGVKLSHVVAEGSVAGVGSFAVCDACTEVESCRQIVRNSEAWHASFWGRVHKASAHDGLVEARLNRRMNYLRQVPS